MNKKHNTGCCRSVFLQHADYRLLDDEKEAHVMPHT